MERVVRGVRERERERERTEEVSTRCHFVGHGDDVYNGLVCNGTICGLAVRPGGCQACRKGSVGRGGERKGRNEGNVGQ